MGGALVFSGTVRLENDGGFASMRTRIDKRDLGGFISDEQAGEFRLELFAIRAYG